MELISSYESDSDEDDSNPWASSRVSVKRPLGRDDESSNRPLKIKLPAPMLLGNPIQHEVIQDDPSLHGNRVRSFPHERGNWASFVYLPWKSSLMFLDAIDILIKHFQHNGIELTVCDDFHVSLTRTIVLRHHWIEGFIASIKKQLHDLKRYTFPLIGNNLTIYVNEENTRTFLALNVIDPSGTLDVLIEKMDCCLLEYQLPTFYKKPSHHVSLAWCVGNKKNELQKLLASVELDAEKFSCNIDELRYKIGHFLFSYGIS